jgi:hypothetical protein
MGYTHDNWKSRIAQRSDLTVGLVHLTRPAKGMTSLDVLVKILSEGKLLGSDTSSGFICGTRKAVCFQEAPIYSLAQNLYTEQEYRVENPKAKTRYLGFGLRFAKPFIFKKGGRPVVYDRTEDAKKYLPPGEWWRIVNFDLNNKDAVIDWTHEREWRLPGDLAFKPSDVNVLLPNENQYEQFIGKCKETMDGELLSKIGGIIQLGAVFY